MEYQGTEQLKKLMAAHKLTRRDVADRLCNGSLHTVNSWLRTDRFRRNVPIAKVQLLELLLKQEGNTDEQK